jgi:hypothetical protein
MLSIVMEIIVCLVIQSEELAVFAGHIVCGAESVVLHLMALEK